MQGTRKRERQQQFEVLFQNISSAFYNYALPWAFPHFTVSQPGTETDLIRINKEGVSHGGIQEAKGKS